MGISQFGVLVKNNKKCFLKNRHTIGVSAVWEVEIR